MLLGFLHMRVLILLCSFLLVIRSSSAQIGALEDSVFIYRSATLAANTDSSRLANNSLAYEALLKALNQEGAFIHPFSKLKNFSIKNLSDKKTRIITWNVALLDDTQQFYGFIVRKNKDGINVFALTNTTKTSTDWEKTTTGADNWLGALYYEVLPAGKLKDTFILLGWRGKDRLLSQKIMDVLIFVNGEPQFGLPIIQHGGSLKYRAVFTYPADIPFSLQYDKENERIVFDRMAPNELQYAGNYAFYSPQFIFDAYKLEKKKWILTQDVNATMPDRKRITPTPPPGQKP